MTHGIWQEFLKIAREEAGSRVVETWFKAVVFDRWDALQKVVYLTAPNDFVKDWIQKNYLSLFSLHLGRLLNVANPKIVFLNGVQKDVSSTANRSSLPVRIKPSKILLPKKTLKNYGHLNKNYVFDSFVSGPSNSLAYAAAHAVTEKPGVLYNPLFIYGESGLGKTHLLHAIGNQIRANAKDATILYQPADRFVTEFINAIRFDKIHKFQMKYHSIDVLLIDDVQFICNKEQTQEAFFHIFNSLYEAHKQIIFSSDTFPRDMKGIADRLRSRLGWGLVTDIHTPSLETKIAILKKKAAANNEELPDDVAHFIASQVTSNIRELEGGLIRIMAFASLTKKEINLELAKKVILRATAAPKQAVNFNYILKCIHKHYPYSIEDLCSKGRSKDLAFARHVAMFLMKKLTNKSLRDIGAFLGGRDHSTVMHALSKVESYLESHPDFKDKLHKLENEISHLG